MSDVTVIAHKTSTVTFTVKSGTRPEIEDAIAERLRSDTELVWIDSPEGVKVDCLHQDTVWKPRKKFQVSHDDASKAREE
jgi:hypothetical protein